MNGTNSILIISDIDGTLISHPFLSGKSVADRESSTIKFLSLFKHRNFGLITGRQKSGFERFFTEYKTEYCLPSFLGVEFASHIAINNEWVVWREQNRYLDELLSEIRRKVESIAEFNTDRNFAENLKNGILNTYFIEQKAICAQIEARYPDKKLTNKFFNFVEPLINHYVARNKNLFLQAFIAEKRIDIVESGFIPKTGFWPVLKKHWQSFELPSPEKVDVVLLGDELYDSYMFFEFLHTYSACFKSVSTCAVRNKLNYATHAISNTDEALSIVEILLNEKNAEVNKILQPFKIGE